MSDDKALRLAQALNNRQECEDDAADELRRLHEEVERLRALLCNVYDNLLDPPISDEWIRQICGRIDAELKEGQQ